MALYADKYETDVRTRAKIDNVWKKTLLRIRIERRGFSACKLSRFRHATAQPVDIERVIHAPF